MICFNCGYKLPSININSCIICGMKFSLVCKSCGYPNPKYASYCFNCGAKLNAQNKSHIEFNESIKKVAVLFADISGFTKLSEKMKPEDLKTLIDSFFEYVTKPIYQYEGTIDKFIGDCVMAVFGAKISHIDDAKRSVICALKMLELTKEFSIQHSIDLNISIGIDYGIVSVGNIGGLYDKDYTVLGDVVNTAQRLQSSCEKGTILVSENIYNETNHTFVYSNSLSVVAKNKEQPIKAYIPISIRDEQINLFDEFIDENNLIKKLNWLFTTRENNVAQLIGPHGIGKTTLIKNWINTIDNKFKVLYISSNKLLINRSFYTIAILICNILNIEFDNIQRIKRNRLLSYLDFLYKDLSYEDILKGFNFLSLILGIDVDESFNKILNSMNYYDIQAELKKQIIKFIKYSSFNNDYILIIDDFDNCDEQSYSIIIDLINEHDIKNKLFILLSSSYKIKKIKSNVIYLPTMSFEAIEKIIISQLKCQYADKKFLKYIYDVTQGNPYFIKEFINTLINENQIVIQNNTAIINNYNKIPISTEKILSEKFSLLDDDCQIIIKIASVLGNEFSSEWLNYLVPNNIYIEKCLHKLIKMKFIYLKSTNAKNNQSIYIFENEILRTFIYNIIPNYEKINIHKSFANLLEKKQDYNSENLYNLLSEHYYLANNFLKALEYYSKLAHLYFSKRLYKDAKLIYEKYLSIANENNISFDIINTEVLYNLSNIYIVTSDYEKAIDILKNIAQKANLNDDKILSKIMLGEIYNTLSYLEESEKIISELENILSKEHFYWGRLLYLKCTLLSYKEDKSVIELAIKSEEILNKNRDYENLAKILNIAALSFYFQYGNSENAIELLNKAFGFAEQSNNLNMVAKISSNLGVIYHSTGNSSKAIKFINKAIDISTNISNSHLLCTLNINLAIIYFEKGQFNKALKKIEFSLHIAKDKNLSYELCLCYINLAEIYIEIGDYQNAKNYLTKSLIISKKINLEAEESIYYLDFAKIYIAFNKYNYAKRFLTKAENILDNINDLILLSDLYRLFALISYKEDNFSETIKYVDKSIIFADNSNNRIKQIKAYRLKAIILAKQNNFSESETLLIKSLDIAKAIESDYEISKCLYRLYILYSEMNNIEKAKNTIIQAKKYIENVDDCIFKKAISSI